MARLRRWGWFLGYRVGNRMVLRGDHVVAYLPRRGKPDAECLIDIIDVPKMEGLCFSVDDHSNRRGVPHRLNTQYAWNRLVGYLHRIIRGNPKGKIIDHKDHNGLNNRRDNLRDVSNAE